MSTNGKLPTNQTNKLQGCRVLVTRAAEQAGEFVALLRQQGAVVIECPTIQLVPPLTWDEIDAAAVVLASFDWLILTSVNGVSFFFNRLLALGLPVPQIPQGYKVCAVGPKTAEALAAFGIKPDLVPQQFTGEGVVAAFKGIDLHGKQILFPKADGARDLIPQELAGKGATVTAPVVYRNILPKTLPSQAIIALEKQELDIVIFSSPSTVRNLAALLGGEEQLRERLAGVAVASIGPVTSRACHELGLYIAVEPEQATFDALLKDLELRFQKGWRPDLIITSPLTRAVQSAQPGSAETGKRSLPHE